MKSISTNYTKGMIKGNDNGNDNTKSKPISISTERKIQPRNTLVGTIYDFITKSL